MSVSVRLNLLGSLNVRQREMTFDVPPGMTLDTLIARIDEQNPEFRNSVIGGDGELSPKYVFFINGRNAVSLAGKRTPVSPGDVVNVIPAIAGG